MAKKKEKSILVVNDDGIYGVGLRPLAEALRSIGKVTVVVPEQERSAASHAITLHKPIRVRHLGESVYIINGTPADCVRFGIFSLLKEKVDVVISGINRGANMGADTIYSGTVGGAMEGCMLGYSSAAFSLAGKAGKNFEPAADFARELAKRLLSHPLPKDVFLNVNVPERPKVRIKGVEVTHLGKRVYGKVFTKRIDPRGETYYWLAGATPSGVADPGSDMAAIERGRISLTPLRLDMTDIQTLHHLKESKWEFNGYGKIQGRLRL